MFRFVSFIQERLTRSSLETQKLELMSAMSELKLQQAVLERENLELRASQFNNNTIGIDRRLPPVPGNRIRTNSSSGSMVVASFFLMCSLIYNFRRMIQIQIMVADAAFNISPSSGHSLQQSSAIIRCKYIVTDSVEWQPRQ